MMRYWMCFAFLEAVLVVPSMQYGDISDEVECETDEWLGSPMQISDEVEGETDERLGSPIQISDEVEGETDEWLGSPMQEEEGSNNGKCNKCGISPAYRSTIVNGNIVNPQNRFPWMVQVHANGKKHCAGFIISERFIMTAAHCVTRPNEAGSTIGLQKGYFNENEVTIKFLSQTRNMNPGESVAEITPHPNYEGIRSVKNDIALIRMSDVIQCSNDAMPICLPSPDMPVRIGSIVDVAGWGATMDLSTTGDGQLRATKLGVEKHRRCKGFIGFNPKGSICLSGKGYSSACFGDSGGPAFRQRSGRFFAIGVASYHSSKLCSSDMPVVYTSVANHVGWIKEVSGADFTN